jgi:hypothetical protein
MDFKTLDDVATWMLSNIRMSRYDDQFINNLTLYITQHGRITSNQDALFKKVASKYVRQFNHVKINVNDTITLPWSVAVIQSAPEYTNASIKIEDGKLIFRSPYNKNFLTALKKNPIYTMQWVRDKRQFEMMYTPTILKDLLYLSADYYPSLVYCENITHIVNSLSAYEDVKYWVPTLVYSNGYYIAATNEFLNEAIKDVEFNDDLKSIAQLVKYGVAIDQTVKDRFLLEDPNKVKLATSFQSDVEISDVDKILEWLSELGCDAISEPKSFLTNYKLPIKSTNIDVLIDPKQLNNYNNPVIVFQRGKFSFLQDRPMKLFKIIKFVNSEPVDLGPK